jgi:hypothetical protein
MKKLILKRPNEIYHVWHYCVRCGKVFDHSAGTWNEHKGEHKGMCCDQQWRDVSVEIAEIHLQKQEVKP